jgi:hypothetical protein
MKSLKVKTTLTVFVLSASFGMAGLGAGMANAAPSNIPLDHHGHGGGGYGGGGYGGGGYGYGGDPITAGINLGSAIVGLVTAGIQAAPPPPAPVYCYDQYGQPYLTPDGMPC